MSAEDNNIRSRLRSSKIRASGPANIIEPPTLASRRPRVRSNPNHTKTQTKPATGPAARRTKSNPKLKTLVEVRARPSGSFVDTTQTTRRTRSSRKLTAVTEPLVHLASTSAAQDNPAPTGRSGRPVRACTVRTRTKSEPKPTTKASAASTKPARAPRKGPNTSTSANPSNPPSGSNQKHTTRAAAKPRGRKPVLDIGKTPGPSDRERQRIVSEPREIEMQAPPSAAPFPEERAETQELFQKLKASKERLQKEFSPVSYTDFDFLSSLYVDLASDNDIARFLLEPDSGFVSVEQDIEAHHTKKFVGETEGGDEDESEADSDYPESEDEEGAQLNEEDLARPAPYPRGLWTQVPLHSTATTTEISASLTRVMQRILEEFAPQAPAGVSRVVVNTSASGDNKTRPDIVVRATGPSFQVPSTREQRILQTTSEEGEAAFIGLGYTNAASVIEVRRESAKGKDKDCVVQLGAFCSEIWAQQPNRQFTRALLITETTVRLLHYDRGGTFITPVFNYHTNPRIFVRLVLGLTSTDETVLGLDTSVQWRIDPASGKKISGTIATMDEHHNTITYDMRSINPRFCSRKIRGRGTMCWTVHNPEGGRHLIVKDAWRAGEGASERVFLEVGRELPGVVTMVCCEDDLAQTNNFRPTSYRSCPGYRNRTKLRVVMEAYGEMILNYKSRYQLIAALKDAIRGHHELVKRRILHRDVSAGNILLGVDDQDGLRGLLIDLDMAIWMDADAPATASASTTITGTRVYQSIAVLWNYAFLKDDLPPLPHDYLDDLESFFYVLCQAMYSKVSAGKSLSEPVQELLTGWESVQPRFSRSYKAEFVVCAFQDSLLDVAYWGEACRDLLQEYHAFIKGITRTKDRIRNRSDIDHESRVALLNDLGCDMERHYLHLDKIFQEALDALKVEESTTESRPPPLATGADPEVLRKPQSPHQGRNLKRSSADMEDTTETCPASKRRH